MLWITTQVICMTGNTTSWTLVFQYQLLSDHVFQDKSKTNRFNLNSLDLCFNNKNATFLDDKSYQSLPKHHLLASVLKELYD